MLEREEYPVKMMTVPVWVMNEEDGVCEIAAVGSFPDFVFGDQLGAATQVIGIIDWD